MEKPAKVVLLGEGRVGKTSLLVRYVNNAYSDRQESTIQASFLSKRLVINDERVTLNVWDTAGQEKFHALGPIYYRDADAALLVYDVTDAQSFTKVKNWVKELRQMVGPDIFLAIAGNKSDLEKNRQVEPADAIAYADSVGAKHFQTSAKLNRGVDETFLYIAKCVLAKREKSPPSSAPMRKGITIVADDPSSKPSTSGSTGCC